MPLDCFLAPALMRFVVSFRRPEAHCLQLLQCLTVSCCAVLSPPPRPVSCQVVIIPIPNSKASPELVEAMIEQVGFFCFGWAGGIVFGGGWMPALVFSWL